MKCLSTYFCSKSNQIVCGCNHLCHHSFITCLSKAFQMEMLLMMENNGCSSHMYTRWAWQILSFHVNRQILSFHVNRQRFIFHVKTHSSIMQATPSTDLQLCNGFVVLVWCTNYHKRDSLFSITSHMHTACETSILAIQKSISIFKEEPAWSDS